MKYAFYSEPSDAWLKVSVEEIRQLGLLSEISELSYISNDGKYAFLARDTDAQIFLNVTLLADWFENINSIRRCTKQFLCDKPCFIRNLRRFNTSLIPAKPIPATVHIHDF